MSGGRWIVIALVCALSGVGCGSKFKTTYPARGQVLWNGKPVAGVKVVLIDEDKEHVIRPSGTTDDDGRFFLSTYSNGDGAPAGSYAAMIVTPLPEPKGQAGSQQPAKPPPPTSKVPVRYSKAETSGLTVVVEPKDNELPPITVTK